MSDGNHAVSSMTSAGMTTLSPVDAGLPYATSEGQSARLAGRHPSSPPANALNASAGNISHGNCNGSGLPDAPPLAGPPAPSFERRQVPPLLDTGAQPDTP